MVNHIEDYKKQSKLLSKLFGVGEMTAGQGCLLVFFLYNSHINTKYSHSFEWKRKIFEICNFQHVLLKKK